MKIVINKCFGGFSLSKAAVVWLADKGHVAAQKERDEGEAMLAKHGPDGPGKSGADNDLYWEKRTAQNWAEKSFGYMWHPMGEELARHDPLLAACIEALGDDKASGALANLSLVEVPDGVDYEIGEYDGMEHIAEKHRTWG